MNDIIRWCFREGKKASSLPPDKQAEIESFVKKRLEAQQEEEISRWSMIGSYLVKKREETAKKLAEAAGKYSIPAYSVSLVYGILFLLLIAVLIASEFFLVRWTLSPFGFSFEASLIAISLTLIGMLAVERYLHLISESKPNYYKKFNLHMVVVSLVVFLAAGLLLSHTRGLLLKASSRALDASDLSNQVSTAARFYQESSYIPFAMGFIAVSLSLVAGVCLHDAVNRIATAVPPIRFAEQLKKEDCEILSAGLRLQEANTLVAKGLAEFERGRTGAEDKKESLFISPIFILIFALILVLILTAVARGEEIASICIVLFDLSSSSQCSDYTGAREFEKNFAFVIEIIKALEPGAGIRIIGITDHSLEKPYVILRGEIPKEKGAFGEKTAKAKLSLIEKWKSISLKPTAKQTDIFGALYLASNMLEGEKGKKKIVILSDMRNTTSVDIESPAYIEESAIKKAEEKGLIPKLEGAEIYALGVSTCGKSFRYFESLKSFWQAFLEKSGASLRAFTFERKIIF